MSGQEEDQFQRDFVLGLYMIVFATAARFDADAEQLARLRATQGGFGDTHYRATGDADPLLAEIQEAMGADWKPGPAFAAKLETLQPK